MREIQFRAKALSGELVYFDLHESKISGDADVFYGRGIPCEVGSEEEYTGLKDKNGKAIYEGDITERMSWIAWCEKCCSFELFLVDFGCSSCTGDVRWDQIVDDNCLVVIGNIYENPNLLHPIQPMSKPSS